MKITIHTLALSHLITPISHLDSKLGVHHKADIFLTNNMYNLT
jgi:hypothetical protein